MIVFNPRPVLSQYVEGAFSIILFIIQMGVLCTVRDVKQDQYDSMLFGRNHALIFPISSSREVTVKS